MGWLGLLGLAAQSATECSPAENREQNLAFWFSPAENHQTSAAARDRPKVGRVFLRYPWPGTMFLADGHTVSNAPDLF